MAKRRYDVFISYRRDGGSDTARIIQERLQDKGYTVFYDVETLRGGDFNTKLYDVIEDCTDFLMVLSKDALERCDDPNDWVRLELECALRANKNIVPVMLRGFAFPDTLPDAINAVRYKNGIEASPEFFDAFIDKLTGFLKAKAPLFRKVFQSIVFMRTWPFLVSLGVVAGLVVGGIAISNRINPRAPAVSVSESVYPSTEAERALTYEMVYYVVGNLEFANNAAAVVEKALNAYEVYTLTGAELDRVNAVLEVNKAIRLLERMDVTQYVLPDSKRDELYDTPYDVAFSDYLHEFLTLYMTHNTRACLKTKEHCAISTKEARKQGKRSPKMLQLVCRSEWQHAGIA